MCRNYISDAGKKMQSAKVNLIFIVKFLSKPVIKLLKSCAKFPNLFWQHKRILLGQLNSIKAQVFKS